VSPRFYLFGTLCQFGRDLIYDPGHVIVSADRPSVLAGGNAIADFRGGCVIVDAGAPAIAAHPDVSELMQTV
jgi:hypothetical protein